MLDHQDTLDEVQDLLILPLAFEDREHELHYHHPTRQHVPLPANLHKLHARAKAASQGASDPDQHAKASAAHSAASKHLHNAGFHGLANQHDTWAQYHHATVTQHHPAAQHGPLVQHPPHGGQGQSGHTLPKQKKQPGPAPQGHPGGHPGAPQGSPHPTPQPKAEKLSRKAHERTHEARHLHYAKFVHPADKVRAHFAAFKAHVKASHELRRHGLHDKAHEHDQHAQTHLHALGYFRKHAPSR